MRFIHRIPILALTMTLAGGVSAQTPASAPVVREAASGVSASATFAPNCRPDYPPGAMRAGAQGNSRMRFFVDESGWVTKVEILQSAGPTPEQHWLDAAAVSALVRCQFKPGRDEAGRPMPSHVDVEYRWVLK
jgi:TonB family protein